jgi:FAM192A/Fyv6, N-terminal domain
MSSRFVSGGTADAPIERSDEWLSAQREIEANIQKKAIEARQQTDGRSLYETLEANKGITQINHGILDVDYNNAALADHAGVI